MDRNNKKKINDFIYSTKNRLRLYDEEVLERIVEQSRIKIELASSELEMRKNGKSTNKCDRDNDTDN